MAMTDKNQSQNNFVLFYTILFLYWQYAFYDKAVGINHFRPLF